MRSADSPGLVPGVNMTCQLQAIRKPRTFSGRFLGTSPVMSPPGRAQRWTSRNPTSWKTDSSVNVLPTDQNNCEIRNGNETHWQRSWISRRSARTGNNGQDPVAAIRFEHTVALAPPYSRRFYTPPRVRYNQRHLPCASVGTNPPAKQGGSSLGEKREIAADRTDGIRRGDGFHAPSAARATVSEHNDDRA